MPFASFSVRTNGPPGLMRRAVVFRATMRGMRSGTVRVKFTFEPPSFATATVGGDPNTIEPLSVNVALHATEVDGVVTVTMPDGELMVMDDSSYQWIDGPL